MSYSSNISSLKRKRNFWLLVSISILLCRSALFVFDWWICVPTLAILGFISVPLNRSPFLWGFLSLLLLWGGYAMYYDTLNEGILSSRMVQLFPLPPKGILMVLVTALLGGLIGGFSTLTGYWLRKWLAPEKVNKYY